MARRRNASRRRRGSWIFLYKVLTVVVVCGAIVTALTLFFKVDTITVTGNQRYTVEEIQSTAGIQNGDNLFLLNKFSVAKRLMQELPYIEEARINRELPDALLINVTECAEAFAWEQEGTVWLMSTRGKIVESRENGGMPDEPVIDGCALRAPSVGSKVVLDDTGSRQDSLLALLAAAKAASVLDQVEAIHLENAAAMTVDYGERFSVELPYNGDYDYLLNYLRRVVETLESNETGTIDLTIEGEAHVRPK